MRNCRRLRKKAEKMSGVFCEPREYLMCGGIAAEKTGMIRTVLRDADGTLPDIHAAGSTAICSLLQDLGPGGCTDEMIYRYSAIHEGFCLTV